MTATFCESGRGPRAPAPTPTRGPRSRDVSVEPVRESEAPGRSSEGEAAPETESDNGDIREGALDAGDWPSSLGVGGEIATGDGDGGTNGASCDV